METRLGDIIDDFCIKCKRITNHAVVSMLGAEAAKVRCRTCYSDHDYRREQAPPPKVDPRKLAAFNAVAAKMNLPLATGGAVETPSETPSEAQSEAPSKPVAEAAVEAALKTLEASAQPPAESPEPQAGPAPQNGTAPKSKRARK